MGHTISRQEREEHKAELELWLKMHDDTHPNYSLIKEAYDIAINKLNTHV